MAQEDCEMKMNYLNGLWKDGVRWLLNKEPQTQAGLNILILIYCSAMQIVL